MQPAKKNLKLVKNKHTFKHTIFAPSDDERAKSATNPNSSLRCDGRRSRKVVAHPNIRAFITHGGVSSLIEAVYFGVPVVGLPSFADQENNLATAVKRGYAVSILMKDITEDSLYKALQEVLNKPKYKQNALKMSKLMRDQPMKPIDSAIYWIEYVIRHRGAPYLRSASLDLKWYQREMLDIFSFLLTLVFVIFYFIRNLFGLIRKKKLTKPVSTDKKDK
ncbi:UDP-glucuronosyltransferase 2C1-like [Tribolium madens]|uniref:UDP-glucuronosyltransferase 2C1-like n=1 Tax=Tribolium madens TaxID=41895 RepID=UPI001CF74A8B|nr:UDP-glucuronosyltransferase 2C1-like [Tribolium madens]